MTIPLSKDFAISSDTVSPAGNGVDAIGLMLTKSDKLGSASAQYFSSLPDVANTFGYISDEYKAASVYFAGYVGAAQLPKELLISGMGLNATGGRLISASNANVKIGDVIKLPPSAITISVDGITQASSQINLSTATTQEDVAKIIETALSGVSVTWDNNKYTIISITTGNESSVTDAKGEIAAALRLTNDDGAVSISGTPEMTLAQVMDRIVDVNTNWFGFACAQEINESEKLELAAWCATQDGGNRYLYATTGRSSDIYKDGAVFVHNGEPSNAFAALGFAASTDFSKTNGRLSYKFRQFTGMTDTITSLSDADALDRAGVNYYGNYSQNAVLKNYAATGVITGQFLWIDTFLDQVWIKANLISAYANLFTNNQSYSFIPPGYAAIKAATLDVMQSAINYGAIKTGVTLDNSQTQIVNQQVGKDITSALYSDGWYLYIPSQPGANRIERSLKGVVLFWVDGQLIQSINMQSTTVL